MTSKLEGVRLVSGLNQLNFKEGYEDCIRNQ
jgi:hypothetical protein